jgi:hypothetical protein
MSANQFLVLEGSALKDAFPMADPSFPTPVTEFPRRHKSRLSWVECERVAREPLRRG